ncbi:PAS domain S-box protein [Desulfurispira natronophila]|uniref:histidine kinase n=1 Tax=Desulfurispira natronophila TaxID=682562 RepID=A0A7W7Y4H1_9BACT|nr:PAS domain S-box protein [Desulfurispira natronophila]MBB5021925.1 PAS domain S-box-containing protein [Desulfurispira natronophila]
MTVLLTASAIQAQPREVTLGVLAFRSVEYTEQRFAPLVDFLDREMEDFSLQLRALGYADLESALDRGEIDFVLTNPSHYVQLAQRDQHTSPLATMIPTHDGVPMRGFGGVIVVPADSPIQELTDLRGKTIATVSKSSLGGYQVQAYELARSGVNPDRHIRLLKTDMPHDLTIKALLAGEVDAAFARSGVLECMMKEGSLSSSAVRVLNKQQAPAFPQILSTPLYPEWPISALAHVDEAIAQQFTSALYRLPHGGETARMANIYGFTVPADYNLTANVLQELQLPPFDTPPVFTVVDVWQRWQVPILTAGSLVTILFVLLISLAVVRRRVQQEQEKSHQILESIGEGVYGVDLAGSCTFINDAALTMLGFQRTEVLGKDQHALFHHTHHDGKPYPHKDCPIHHTLQDFQPRDCSDWFVRKDGSHFPVKMIVTPLRSHDRVTGAVVSFQDMSEQHAARKALEHERLRLAGIIEGTGAGTWEWNVQTGEATFNERWAEVFGYRLSELEPVSVETWEHFVHPEDLEQSACLLQQHFDGNLEHYELETRVRHRDGHWVWVLDRGKVISWTEDGRPLMMMGTLLDITARKTTQIAIQDLTNRLQKLTDNIPGFVYQFIMRPDGTYAFPYASRHTYDIYGVRPEEVVESADKVFSVLHPDDLGKVVASIQRSAENLTLWHQVYRVNHPDGTQIWVEGIANPERLECGSVLWHGYIYNISTRVQRERELKKIDERYRLTAEALSTGVWDWDIANDIVMWDEQCYCMLDYEPNAFPVSFSVWKSLIHPDDVAVAEQEVHSQLKQGDTFITEFRYQTASGDWLWVQGKGRAVEWDEVGQPVRMLGTHMNIQQRKEAEQALVESEWRFRLFAESSDTIFWLQSQGEFLYISPAFEKLTGIPCQEICCSPERFLQPVHESYREEIKSLVSQDLCAESSESIGHICQVQVEKGTNRWFHMRAFPATGQYLGRSCTVGVAEDITEQVQHAETLSKFNEELQFQVDKEIRQRMQSELSYLTLFDKSPEGILVLDPSGRILDCNRSAADIFAKESQLIIGKLISEIGVEFFDSHGERMDVVGHLLEQILPSVTKRQELEIINGEGCRRYLQALISMLPLEEQGQFVVLLRDDTNVVQLQKEKRAQELFLVQQSKMAEIGGMIGAIAHQWKQPLNNIAMRIQMLPMDFAEKTFTADDVEDLSEQVMQSINFMGNTVNEFQDFFRAEKDEGSFDVRAAIESVIRIIAGQLKADAIAVEISSSSSALVYGRCNHFQQVILNITNNAREELIQNRSESDRKLKIDLEQSPNGDEIVIHVSDNAGGIPGNLLPSKIFEPHVSTKGDKGMGIGLSLCATIVHRMGGSIGAINTEEGARFSITLPVWHK